MTGAHPPFMPYGYFLLALISPLLPFILSHSCLFFFWKKRVCPQPRSFQKIVFSWVFRNRYVFASRNAGGDKTTYILTSVVPAKVGPAWGGGCCLHGHWWFIPWHQFDSGFVQIFVIASYSNEKSEARISEDSAESTCSKNF